MADHSEPFLLFEVYCGTPPSCLKVMGWVGGGGLQHFSVSPRPLGFGFLVFGAKGLGPGLDNKETMASFIARDNKHIKLMHSYEYE